MKIWRMLHGLATDIIPHKEAHDNLMIQEFKCNDKDKTYIYMYIGNLSLLKVITAVLAGTQLHYTLTQVFCHKLSFVYLQYFTYTVY